MSESTHDDELTAFQVALERLQPTPDGINIAQLLFRAGRLSAPRRSWIWPCAAAASMMLAATLGSVLLLRPTPQPAERIVTVYIQTPVPSVGAASRAAPQVRLGSPDLPAFPPEPERPASGGDYLHIRRAVLAKGLDALPPPAPWPAAALPDDTNTLFDMPHDSRDPWFLRLKRSLKSGDAS